jgi:uncharacterized protein involved in exopolysaccharide biosynthesis
LESLKTGKEKLGKRIDSARSNELARQVPETSGSASTSILLGQLQQYEELIGEYQLTLDTKPAVLVVVEEARASEKPDKPQRLKLLVATVVISFLFSFLLALFLERRKRRAL